PSCSSPPGPSRLRWGCGDSRLTDLVFAPTPACRGDHRARRLSTFSRSLEGAEAGLTSKSHHARRPRLALRGSFRLRLASTTGDDPRATTDPDGSPGQCSTGPEGGRKGPERPP